MLQALWVRRILLRLLLRAQGFLRSLRRVLRPLLRRVPARQQRLELPLDRRVPLELPGQQVRLGLPVLLRRDPHHLRRQS